MERVTGTLILESCKQTKGSDGFEINCGINYNNPSCEKMFLF